MSLTSCDACDGPGFDETCEAGEVGGFTISGAACPNVCGPCNNAHPLRGGYEQPVDCDCPTCVLTAQRDQARRIAVALEQELAAVTA